MKVKIKPLENYIKPVMATEDASCFDVFASRIELNGTKDKAIIYLGFATEIPKGWKGVLVPRSGQNKTYWNMLNSPGQIDSDYRGEWQIRMTLIPAVDTKSTYPHFFKATEFPFKVGERVGQMYFERVNEVELEEVEELSDTERGSGGFGSTGK